MRLFNDGDETVLSIEGWPNPFTPRTLSRIRIPSGIRHEKIKVLYNGRMMGYLKDGRFKLTKYFTGLRAYLDFLRSK